MYISVIGLGIFYIITVWAPFAGYATVNAARRSRRRTTPPQYYLQPANAIAGHWVGSMLSYLIITGSFACGMAFHNTTSRYFYSLGREGLLPRALGRTHPKWKSPHIASVTQSVIAALIILGFAVFVGTGDPPPGLPPGLRPDGGHGRDHHPEVQALVSLSILIYFERHHEDSALVEDQVAPAIAFISQAFVVYLLFKNIQFLGSGYSYANWLGPIDLLVVPVGIGVRVLPEAPEPGEIRVRRTARSTKGCSSGWGSAGMPAGTPAALPHPGGLRHGLPDRRGHRLAERQGPAARPGRPRGRLGRARLHDQPPRQRLGRAGSCPVAGRADGRGRQANRARRARPARSAIWVWPRRWTASSRSTRKLRR